MWNGFNELEESKITSAVNTWFLRRVRFIYAFAMLFEWVRERVRLEEKESQQHFLAMIFIIRQDAQRMREGRGESLFKFCVDSVDVFLAKESARHFFGLCQKSMRKEEKENLLATLSRCSYSWTRVKQHRNKSWLMLIFSHHRERGSFGDSNCTSVDHRKPFERQQSELGCKQTKKLVNIITRSLLAPLLFSFSRSNSNSLKYQVLLLLLLVVFPPVPLHI